MTFTILSLIKHSLISKSRCLQVSRGVACACGLLGLNMGVNSFSPMHIGINISVFPYNVIDNGQVCS